MSLSLPRQGRWLGATILLAGCVAPPSNQPAPVQRAPVRPPVLNTTGLESVVGHNARSLENLFGKPDLDVRETNARKLQFSSSICVLDTYLYPPSRGAEPVVTWIDARLPDGKDIDRASCVAALSRREEAR